MKAFQQTLLGEGEAAAPHRTVLAERLSLPSPRKRGEGAITSACISAQQNYFSLSATFSTPALAHDSSPAWLLPLTPTPPIVSLPTLIG